MSEAPPIWPSSAGGVAVPVYGHEVPEAPGSAPQPPGSEAAIGVPEGPAPAEGLDGPAIAFGLHQGPRVAPGPPGTGVPAGPGWPVGNSQVPPLPPTPVLEAGLAPAAAPTEPEVAAQRPPRVGWLRQSTFRSRISILVASAVGVAITLAAVAAYMGVRSDLNHQVNQNLQAAEARLPVQTGFFGGLDPRPIVQFQLQTGDQVQVLGVSALTNQETASIVQASTQTFIAEKFFPVTDQAQQVYEQGSQAPIVVQTLKGPDGKLYRVATVGAEKDLAVQIGVPLTDVDHTLSYLRLILVLVVAAGVALAMALGWAVGRATIQPVEDLTLAAEHVAKTQDLSATIDDSGNDELARLARSFNAMLSALSASRLQQAHLVSDAGHELRTPLTSLRTNIEVLMRKRDLAGPDRDELLSDVDAQLQELTTLVGDLVDLAREDEKPDAEPELVALDELVNRALERAKRRALGINFDVHLAPGQVQAQPALLERAIMNVLDNAAKWSPSGGTVTVSLEAIGAWHLTVTDQGPGIAPDDLPHIFERFYRAAAARSLPGSGLGLAIVQRVVTSHGGSVRVSTPPGGGTQVEIVLPLPSTPLPA